MFSLWSWCQVLFQLAGGTKYPPILKDGNSRFYTQKYFGLSNKKIAVTGIPIILAHVSLSEAFSCAEMWPWHFIPLCTCWPRIPGFLLADDRCMYLTYNTTIFFFLLVSPSIWAGDQQWFWSRRDVFFLIRKFRPKHILKGTDVEIQHYSALTNENYPFSKQILYMMYWIKKLICIHMAV